MPTSARLGTIEFAADFRQNGVHCAGRCGHRPLQTYKQYRNRKLSGWSQFCARRGRQIKSRAAARNITRLLRIFLPTFSGATEKVGRRRHSSGVAARTAVPVKPDRRADMGIGPYRGGKSWRSRKSGPPEARLQCNRKMTVRCQPKVSGSTEPSHHRVLHCIAAGGCSGIHLPKR